MSGEFVTVLPTEFPFPSLPCGRAIEMAAVKLFTAATMKQQEHSQRLADEHVQHEAPQYAQCPVPLSADVPMHGVTGQESHGQDLNKDADDVSGLGP